MSCQLYTLYIGGLDMWVVKSDKFKKWQVKLDWWRDEVSFI